MKKMLMTVAAAATLGMTALSAMPAAAQPYGGGYGAGYGGGYGGGYSDHGYGDRGNSTSERIQRLQWRITQSERSGDLNHWEARRLYDNLYGIRRLEARYRYDGNLTRWERNDINQRLDQLSQRLRYQRTDDDRGYGGPRRY